MNQTIVKHPQQIGPVEIWPLRRNVVSSHQYAAFPLEGHVRFTELEEPSVPTIRAENLGDEPLFIPSGWIVGGDSLHQVRTLNYSAFLQPRSSASLDVACVEQGRWSAGNTPLDGGRAPTSVMAAGRSYTPQTGSWEFDRSQRQHRVWGRVAAEENRSGRRPTSSLQEIMSEDSQSQPHIRRLQHSFRQNLRFEPDCNGYVITLNGEPLLMEIYTSNRVASQLLRKTLDALAFDAVTERPSKPTDVASIRKFMQSASRCLNSNNPPDGWSTALRGGDESVASFFTLDDEFKLLQMTAMNQRHMTLIGV